MPERCSQIAAACIKHLQRLASGGLSAAQHHSVCPPSQLHSVLKLPGSLCWVWPWTCRTFRHSSHRHDLWLEDEPALSQPEPWCSGAVQLCCPCVMADTRGLDISSPSVIETHIKWGTSNGAARQAQQLTLDKLLSGIHVCRLRDHTEQASFMSMSCVMCSALLCSLEGMPVHAHLLLPIQTASVPPCLL